MTQEEAIDNLCDVIERELRGIRAKLADIYERLGEGVTVYHEEVR